MLRKADVVMWPRAGVGAVGPANPESHHALLCNGPDVAGRPHSIPMMLRPKQTYLSQDLLLPPRKILSSRLSDWAGYSEDL